MAKVQFLLIERLRPTRPLGRLGIGSRHCYYVQAALEVTLRAFLVDGSFDQISLKFLSNSKSWQSAGKSDGITPRSENYFFQVL